MVTAYLLVISESGAERKIVDNLLDVEGVEEVELVYGEYDIIAKIIVDEISQLSDFIIEKVRPIGHIKRTSTLIVAGE